VESHLKNYIKKFVLAINGSGMKFEGSILLEFSFIIMEKL